MSAARGQPRRCVACACSWRARTSTSAGGSSTSAARSVPLLRQPIPILVGGRSDAALTRTGQLGDGWLALWVSPRRFAEALDRIDSAAADAGRDGVDWRHALQLWAGFGSSRGEARRRLAGAMEARLRAAVRAVRALRTLRSARSDRRGARAISSVWAAGASTSSPKAWPSRPPWRPWLR